MHKNKKILIIATAFSPENEIGALRVTKLIKYLVRSNCEVTIISPELHEGSRINKGPEPVEFEAIKRCQVHQSDLFIKLFLNRRNKMIGKSSATQLIKKSKGGIVSQLKSALMGLFQFLYALVRNYDWAHEVKKSQFYRDCLKEDYDVVFSSYPSVSAHWVALHAVRNLKIPLICDFRDPMNYETNSSWFYYKMNSFLQRKIIKRAAVVTTIAEDLIPKLKDGYTYPNTKFVYLPNGYDQDDLEASEQAQMPNDKLIFCYVGSLYGGQRKLDSFFVSINKLLEKKSIPKEKIIFNYAGKEFEVLKNLATAYGLEDILVNKGFVSRQESIDLQANSDIVVVVTWNTKKDKGIMTGKLFECFLTKKQVLVVVNGNVENSEIKRVVERVNGGYVIEDASTTFNKDKDRLIEYLENSYTLKVANGHLSSTYNEKIEDFSYDNIVKKLVSIFNIER